MSHLKWRLIEIMILVVIVDGIASKFNNSICCDQCWLPRIWLKNKCVSIGCHIWSNGSLCRHHHHHHHHHHRHHHHEHSGRKKRHKRKILVHDLDEQVVKVSTNHMIESNSMHTNVQSFTWNSLPCDFTHLQVLYIMCKYQLGRRLKSKSHF